RGNRVHVITTLLLFNERRFTLAETGGADASLYSKKRPPNQRTALVVICRSVFALRRNAEH
ncbi:hypothetical protein J0J37_22445, partial [Vibrio vulnificus]|uniref:hypothetical protein n=1 Tax=Vibrio vulnificus TaxID=672 RepID=UPI0019D4C96C